MARLRKLFGMRIRELRVRKGLNQLDLATLCSVSEDFISLVERGISAPSFDTIEQLAMALETTSTDLFMFDAATKRATNSRAKTRRPRAVGTRRKRS